MFSQTTFEQFKSATFEALRTGKKVVTVVREVLGDFVTPVMAYQKLATNHGAALLESVSGGKHQGRHSFIAAKPYLKFRASHTWADVEWLGSTFNPFSISSPAKSNLLARIQIRAFF